MNVLIVDDNHTNRKLLGVTLESEGHHILHASNGAEALALLGRHSVDAVISDVLMPIMDGYQLCCAVRGFHRLRHVPFIFYSSHYATDEGESFGKACGANRYVQKPASTFSILSALYDVIREKQETSPVRRARTIQKIYSRSGPARREEPNRSHAAVHHRSRRAVRRAVS
ncbi:MAG: response regulator [Verrucomicrobiales bacterium]|nr:response regulator [Verrucomicrobiales bacterium]